MTKYWPPIECQYTQRQNKAPILRRLEAVLSATFVVQSQAAAGSTPELTYFPVGRNLPILESMPSRQSKAISSRALAACWAPFTMRYHIDTGSMHQRRHTTTGFLVSAVRDRPTTTPFLRVDLTIDEVGVRRSVCRLQFKQMDQNKCKNQPGVYCMELYSFAVETITKCYVK